MPGVALSGFWGKLPARGDFVRAGLPRSFVEPWDAWLQSALQVPQALALASSQASAPFVIPSPQYGPVRSRVAVQPPLQVWQVA